MANFSDYLQLMRLDRPVGSLLLLWPTYWGLFMAAEGLPDPVLFVVFTIGVIAMRSAGCVINDYADRDFDKHVERTKNRPITSGRVSPKEALILFFTLLAISAFLLIFLNPLTIAMAFVGAFLAATYPFFKRFTHLPQAYLGLAFSWAIPMAFAAQTDSLPIAAWILMTANILWVIAYDTAYAITDKPDDLNIGIKSTAILFGRWDKTMVAVFHLLSLALMAYLGYHLSLAWPYYFGLVCALLLSVYQQYLMLTQGRQGGFLAFKNSHWTGFAVFLGIVSAYLLG